MRDNVDYRAGYRVPDGYFSDFSVKMAVMAAAETAKREKRTRVLIFRYASAVAAVLLLFVGLFGYYRTNSSSSDSILASITELPSDVLVTNYLGASENDVIDHFLPEEDDNISEEDVISYLSDAGGVNLYAILDL